MQRMPKIYIPGRVYELCFRTEDGLPLVCTAYMKTILKGILAYAFGTYDVQLISYIVMGNHIHIHIIVVDPEQVDDAVCYFKRESAHAINNLLGRKRHTVWQEGYDSALIADAEHIVTRFTYFFTNPARAGVVNSIDDYPGLSSWGSFFSEDFYLSGRRIPREVIPKIRGKHLSAKEQGRLNEELLESALPEVRVKVDPHLITKAFPEASTWTREELCSRVIMAVRQQEVSLSKARKKPVLGVAKLRAQLIDKSYYPTKFGKKMWVLGSSQETRMPIINWIKELLAERLTLKLSLSKNEFLKVIPPGFFAPGGFLRANLNPALVPI